MIRKQMLIVLVTFVRDPRLRIYCIIWSLLVFLALQWACWPFERRLANILETASLLSLLVSLNLLLLWFYPLLTPGVCQRMCRGSTAVCASSANTEYHKGQGWAWTMRAGQGCIRRKGTSEAAPEAVRQAVGGGCQSGWGRLPSVTNAIEAGTWRQGDSGWA